MTVGSSATSLAADVSAISRTLNATYPSLVRDSEETIGWRRIAKLSEEVGEVIEAWLGYLGENPRKGRTHTKDDVLMELLEVAGCALAAYEHVSGHNNECVEALVLRMAYVRDRLNKAVAVVHS